jgi:hypothetical protein
MAALVVGISCARSLPPLAAGLPRNFEAGNREFNRRIHEHFPVGLPAAALIDELQNEGFKPWPDSPDLHEQHVFSLERSGFPCKLEWRVIWSTDSAAILTDVHGLYGATCL